MRPPPIRRALLCVAAACALVLAPPTSYGRVFQKLPGAASVLKRLESAGATQAYRSRVTVNGVGADLIVLSFDLPLSDAASTMRSALGTNFVLHAGGLASPVLPDGDRPLHLLVSEVAASRTLVFVMLLDRSPDPSAAVPWPVSAIPLMPGAATVFSFENTSTHMRFGIAKTTDTAAAAASFCERHLKSRGWEAQGPQQASLTVYVRKQELCLFMVEEASRTGEGTRIVVMEKRLGSP